MPLFESTFEKLSLNFSSLTVNFKITSTIGSGYSGKRMNSGRKRIFGSELDQRMQIRDRVLALLVCALMRGSGEFSAP